MGMNVTRRQKFINKNTDSKKTIKTKKRININFDLPTLSLLSSFVMSSNSNIRRSSYINLRNLMNVLDMGIYANDEDRMKRIEFINKALDARLIYNIQEPMMVMKYARGGIVNDNSTNEDDIIQLSEFGLLSNQEIDWVNDTISGALKYAFIEDEQGVDRGLDVLARFKAADYRARDEIVKEIEEWINYMQTSFRRVRSQSVTDLTFSLKPGEYEETVKEIYNIVSSPGRKLKCGMQGLNEMIAGGFENSRVYGFLGSTGIGKSLVLLNLAVQIKKFNKDLKPKDPTKIPTITILTMENTVVETVTRLFNIVGASDEMKNYSLEEVIKIIKEDGELFLSDDSPINILIKYMPNKSVDTSYLYTLVEDLEDEGYETICLIQDHLKRIRSCTPCKDERIEYGEIVNEMKVFAQIKDIPVLTNTHLNRDAAKIVDEQRRNNKADLTRMMGRSNIGESMLILDNIDFAFIINVEYDSKGQKYMVFSRVKNRDRASDRDYICQPFTEGNNIRLVIDEDQPVPAFKESLKETPNELFKNGGLNRSRGQNSIPEIAEIISEVSNNRFDDDTNLFSGSMYKEKEQIKEIEQETREMGEYTYPINSMLNEPVIINGDPVAGLYFEDEQQIGA